MLLENKSVHQSQGHWMGPVRLTGVESGNLWVSHGATPIKYVRKNKFGWHHLLRKEMRKTMIGLGAEDSEDSNMPQNRKQQRRHPQPPVQLQTEQSSTALQKNRRSAEARAQDSAKQREPEAWCRSHMWCLSKAWCPNQAFCLNQKMSRSQTPMTWSLKS